MALVSKKHNFIFVHIFRCGGNSVRKMLGAPAVGSTVNTLNGKEVLGVHVDAVDLKQYYENIGKSAFYDNAFKFTFVRNPFSWLVSTYKYIAYSPGHGFNSTVCNMNYLEFLHWYVEVAMKLNRPFGANKYQQLHHFIYNEDEELLVDFVGNMEHLSRDMKVIEEETGITIDTIEHINRTVSTSWKSYYNHNSIKYVQNQFQTDLKWFDYSY